MATFKLLSRYTNGKKTINRDSKEFMVLRDKLLLEPNEDDVFVQLTEELVSRPDLISFKAYDTPDLWWVIYEFNKIRDPFFELKSTDLLRIPSKTRVVEAIDSLGKK